MGYLKDAYKKLFINNDPEDTQYNKVSYSKLSVMMFGLCLIGIFELSATKVEIATGETEYKPSNYISGLLNQENHVEFKKNDPSCSEKYVTTIVENHGSQMKPSTQLFAKDCSIKNPIYSTKAIREFHDLKNKSTFRIKYATQGKYQKIISVSDAGAAGFTEVIGIFDTIEVRNNCVSLNYQQICKLPKLHKGTYKASFVVDQEFNLVTIHQLERF